MIASCGSRASGPSCGCVGGFLKYLYNASTTFVAAGKAKACRVWFVEAEAQIRSDFKDWLAETAMKNVRKARAVECQIDKQACQHQDPDASARSASSNLVSKGKTYSDGRLASDSAWLAASNNANQWYQIDVGSVVHLAGIVTKGRADYNHWVTKYEIKVSNDTNAWIDADKDAYTGNINKKQEVQHIFSHQVTARYVRIYPKEWHSHVALRAGLLCGPQPDDSKLMPETPEGYKSRLAKQYRFNKGLCKGRLTPDTMCGKLRDDTGDCLASYAKKLVGCEDKCNCHGAHFQDFWRARLIQGLNKEHCVKWYVNWESDFLKLAAKEAQASGSLRLSKKVASCCDGTTFVTPQKNAAGEKVCADDVPTGTQCPNSQ